MARKVKCPVCENMNEKEETITLNGRYYCKECYKTKEDNIDGYRRLISYICRLYRIDKPTGIILRQIKEFKTDYNFTDDGIYMTLKYYYELLGNNLVDGVGIGIVPYYYEKTKQYYLTSINIEDKAEQYVEDNKKIIEIDSAVRDKMFNSIKRKSMNFEGIDWSELDE